MSLKGTLALLTLQSDKVTAWYDRRLREILKSSVKTWLAVASSKIPTYSGMSRGTLLKLAETVGYPISIFPICLPGRNKEFPANAIHVGRQHSEGRLLLEKGRYGMFYSFDRFDVARLGVNEDHDARQWGFRLKTPGPYNFLSAANAAFKRDSNAQMRSFRHDIKQFIKVSARKIG